MQQAASHATMQNNGDTATVQLYDVGFKHALLVPMKDILYIPQQVLRGQVQHPMLCQRNHFCSYGTSCNFVHARTTNIQKVDPGHVNFAWKMAKKCTRYERLPAGQQIEVEYPAAYLENYAVPAGMAEVAGASPNAVAVPSAHVLKTRGTEQGCDGRVVTMCLNFLVNRICSQGANCCFAHVLHIDPEAKPNQRAPFPARIPCKDQCVASVAPSVASLGNQTEVAKSMSETPSFVSHPPSPPSPPVSSPTEAPPSSCSTGTLKSQRSSKPTARRGTYRHDPYSVKVLPYSVEVSIVENEYPMPDCAHSLPELSPRNSSCRSSCSSFIDSVSAFKAYTALSHSIGSTVSPPHTRCRGTHGLSY